MDTENIHQRINEMGKYAGQGLEENARIIYSLLVTLHGSGLVASLAFIGTSLSAKLRVTHMPFYWCVIFFGIGIIASFVSFLSNYLYFRMAVAKHHRCYLDANPSELTDLNGLIPVLDTLATATKGQRICATLQKYLLILSTLAFAIGLIVGVCYLNNLNANFNSLVSDKI